MDLEILVRKIEEFSGLKAIVKSSEPDTWNGGSYIGDKICYLYTSTNYHVETIRLLSRDNYHWFPWWPLPLSNEKHPLDEFCSEVFKENMILNES